MKRVKQCISILLSAAIVLAMFVIAPLTAGALYFGDYLYNATGNTATITKYNGTATSLNIPSKIDG